jgi:4-amino-4-deoxy-L-arabinose transferase-like glycosyltransferase
MIEKNSAEPDWPVFMKNRFLRWCVIVPALFAYAMAFHGTRVLYEPDEGRYTAVALQMVRSGDFIHPRLNDDLPHYTKPPLAYWAVAASISAFGRSEWVVRLPAAVAFLVTVFLMYRFGMLLMPKRRWLPAAIYATSLVPYIVSNFNNPDTLLAMWETLAVLGFYKGWLYGDNKGRRRWYILMWAAFGLAFLTKGPPGLLPLISIAVFGVWREGGKFLRRLFIIPGVVVFAVLGLTWYVVVAVREPGLLKYFVEVECFGRWATTIHKRNTRWYKPFIIYFPMLFVGSLPWIAFGFSWFKKIGKLFQRSFWKKKMERNPAWALFFLWFTIPLLVFVLAKSRLPVYILPLFAPLSLLLALRISAVSDFRTGRWVAGVVAACIICITVKAVVGYSHFRKDDRDMAGVVAELLPEAEKLIFVNCQPRYGLAFYLDVIVGSNTIEKLNDPHLYKPPKLFAQEVTNDVTQTGFLMTDYQLERAKTIARGHKLKCRILGKYDDLQIVRFFP